MKLVKKDCGKHFGIKGGSCSKCSLFGKAEYWDQGPKQRLVAAISKKEEIMRNIDAESLVNLAMVEGVDSVREAAEGRRIYDEPTRAASLFPFPALVEAVRDYEPSSMQLATDFQSKALEIGRTIPKLQLLMRSLPATAEMHERKAVLAMLDAGLEAQRQLQAWSSRAGEYKIQTEGIRALHEFDGLVKILRTISKVRT